MGTSQSSGGAGGGGAPVSPLGSRVAPPHLPPQPAQPPGAPPAPAPPPPFPPPPPSPTRGFHSTRRLLRLRLQFPSRRHLRHPGDSTARAEVWAASPALAASERCVGAWGIIRGADTEAQGVPPVSWAELRRLPARCTGH